MYHRHVTQRSQQTVHNMFTVGRNLQKRSHGCCKKSHNLAKVKETSFIAIVIHAMSFVFVKYAAHHRELCSRKDCKKSAIKLFRPVDGGDSLYLCTTCIHGMGSQIIDDESDDGLYDSMYDYSSDESSPMARTNTDNDHASSPSDTDAAALLLNVARTIPVAKDEGPGVEDVAREEEWKEEDVDSKTGEKGEDLEMTDTKEAEDEKKHEDEKKNKLKKKDKKEVKEVEVDLETNTEDDEDEKKNKKHEDEKKSKLKKKGKKEVKEVLEVDLETDTEDDEDEKKNKKHEDEKKSKLKEKGKKEVKGFFKKNEVKKKEKGKWWLDDDDENVAKRVLPRRSCSGGTARLEKPNSTRKNKAKASTKGNIPSELEERLFKPKNMQKNPERYKTIMFVGPEGKTPSPDWNAKQAVSAYCLECNVEVSFKYGYYKGVLKHYTEFHDTGKSDHSENMTKSKIKTKTKKHSPAGDGKKINQLKEELDRERTDKVEWKEELRKERAEKQQMKQALEALQVKLEEQIKNSAGVAAQVDELKVTTKEAVEEKEKTSKRLQELQEELQNERNSENKRSRKKEEEPQNERNAENKRSRKKKSHKRVDSSSSSETSSSSSSSSSSEESRRKSRNKSRHKKRKRKHKKHHRSKRRRSKSRSRSRSRSHSGRRERSRQDSYRPSPVPPYRRNEYNGPQYGPQYDRRY